MPFLITFYLTDDELLYDDFFNTLFDLCDNRYIQLFDGCILIVVHLSAVGIRNQLIPHLTSLDKLFIARLTYSDMAGQLSDKQKKWMKENIKKPKDYSDQLRK